MVIRKRPELDTENPPGRVKYIRDMIRRYYDEEEEGTFQGRTGLQAPTPLPDAEKRLEDLKQALLGLCDEHEKARDQYGNRQGSLATVATWRIRQIIDKH